MSGYLQRKKPMKRRGKRTIAWDWTRRKLKVAFERAGITSCEIMDSSWCTGNHNLSFAHSLKRRFIATQAQLEEVALACVNCHDNIEKLGHVAMARIVRETIAARETPVVLK